MKYLKYPEEGDGGVAEIALEYKEEATAPHSVVLQMQSEGTYYGPLTCDNSLVCAIPSFSKSSNFYTIFATAYDDNAVQLKTGVATFQGNTISSLSVNAIMIFSLLVTKFWFPCILRYGRRNAPFVYRS